MVSLSANLTKTKKLSAAWTEEGEIFTLVLAKYGNLGYGGNTKFASVIVFYYSINR